MFCYNAKCMTPFPIFQLFKNNNNFKAANALFFVFDLTVGHCKLTFVSCIGHILIRKQYLSETQ